MRLVGENKLRKFALKHANARSAINKWITAAKAAQWKTFSDVQNTFNSTDFVKGKLVFNLGGNNYRIIAVATFVEGTLYINQVMTHAEYDRWKP